MEFIHMNCALRMQPEQSEGFLEEGIISPARMRAVDANAVALGVTELQLMESAGKALADMARTACPERILVLCGKGNNGGDGMVAARHLQRDVMTDVCYLDNGKRSDSCEHQLSALKHCRVALHPFRCRDDLEAMRSLFERADVIIDALLGIGSRGPVQGAALYLCPDGKCIQSADHCRRCPDPGNAGGSYLCIPQGQD